MEDLIQKVKQNNQKIQDENCLLKKEIEERKAQMLVAETPVVAQIPQAPVSASVADDEYKSQERGLAILNNHADSPETEPVNCDAELENFEDNLVDVESSLDFGKRISQVVMEE